MIDIRNISHAIKKSKSMLSEFRKIVVLVCCFVFLGGCAVFFSDKEATSPAKRTYVKQININEANKLEVQEDLTEGELALIEAAQQKVIYDTVKLKDIKKGKTPRLELMFTNDGNHIAIMDTKGQLTVWNGYEWENQTIIEGTGNVPTLFGKLNKESQQVVSTGPFSDVFIWDLEDTSNSQVLKHTELVMDIESINRNHVVTVSSDNRVRVWDVEASELIGNYVINSEATPRTVASTFEHMYVGDNQGTVTQWPITGDLSNIQPKILYTQLGPIMDVEVNEEANLLLSVAADGTAILYDVSKEESVEAVTDGSIKFLGRYETAVLNGRISPDGYSALIMPANDDAVLWDTRTGNILDTLSGDQDRVVKALYHPTKPRLITTHGDNEFFIWDAATGEKIADSENYDEPVSDILFHPVHELIIASSYDGSIDVYDFTGKKLQQLVDTKGTAVVSIDISPSEDRIAILLEGGEAFTWRMDYQDSATPLKLIGEPEYINDAWLAELF